MRLLIQRVTKASVEVEGQVIGAIDKGYMVLLGACESDTKEIADKMIRKMVNLRIFADAEGKTNLSLQDVGGSILMVSQFTLYADCKKGNRPSFIKSGDPKHANMIYEYTIDAIRNQYGVKVETGSFGADMAVSLVNDGPFTVMLDSDEIC